jgi:hypothetical protein
MIINFFQVLTQRRQGSQCCVKDIYQTYGLIFLLSEKHMTTMDSTKGLLDDKNLKLWKKLSSAFNINILHEDIEHYRFTPREAVMEIAVNKNAINPAQFTHELLHLDLRHKGIFSTSALKSEILKKENLKNLLTENTLELIGNCIAHVKMFPAFIKLGYQPCDFMSDYYVNKFSDEEASDLIKRFVSHGKYSAIGINVFIIKFFSARTCPNKEFNYKSNLDKLEKIDHELYSILDRFLNSWENFDIEKIKTDEFQNLTSDFVDALEGWTKGKIIE